MEMRAFGSGVGVTVGVGGALVPTRSESHEFSVGPCEQALRITLVSRIINKSFFIVIPFLSQDLCLTPSFGGKRMISEIIA
jgi:hypothetical protein